MPFEGDRSREKKTLRRFTASGVCWAAAVVQCKGKAGRKNRSVILSLVVNNSFSKCNYHVHNTVFLAGPLCHISGKVNQIPDINPIEMHRFD